MGSKFITILRSLFLNRLLISAITHDKRFVWFTFGWLRVWRSSDCFDGLGAISPIFLGRRIHCRFPSARCRRSWFPMLFCIAPAFPLFRRLPKQKCGLSWVYRRWEDDPSFSRHTITSLLCVF